jgi:hypothetical protein
VRDPAEDMFERPVGFVKIGLRGNLVGSNHFVAVNVKVRELRRARLFTD